MRKRYFGMLLISVFTIATFIGCGNDVSVETACEAEIVVETETEIPHVHTFVEEITKDATCVEEGIKTLTCECGEVKTESIRAIGHVFENYESNNDATYEADGTETAKCNNCDETDKRVVEGSMLVATEELVPEKKEATQEKPVEEKKTVEEKTAAVTYSEFPADLKLNVMYTDDIGAYYYTLNSQKWDAGEYPSQKQDANQRCMVYNARLMGDEGIDMTEYTYDEAGNVIGEHYSTYINGDRARDYRAGRAAFGERLNTLGINYYSETQWKVNGEIVAKVYAYN